MTDQELLALAHRYSMLFVISDPLPHEFRELGRAVPRLIAEKRALEARIEKVLEILQHPYINMVELVRAALAADDAAARKP